MSTIAAGLASRTDDVLPAREGDDCASGTAGRPLMSVDDALASCLALAESIAETERLRLIEATGRIALGIGGWSLGLALILLFKDYFPRRVVLEPINAAALGGIIIIVCIAASGLGVRAALKVDPATAIGG